jgi:hypothetical protein
MYTKQPDQPGPPHWLPYVLVASADRASEAAIRAGGRIVHGPVDVPGGDRIAMGRDPQGTAFALHSLKPAARKPAAKRTKRAVVEKRATRRAGKPAKKKVSMKSAKKAAKRKPARATRKVKAKAKAKTKRR